MTSGCVVLMYSTSISRCLGMHTTIEADVNICSRINSVVSVCKQSRAFLETVMSGILTDHEPIGE